MTTEPVGPRPPISIEAAQAAAAQRARAANDAATQRSAVNDEVELSAPAREVLRFSAAARASAERTELLGRLHDDVRSGAYRPDPRAIARALIERGL